MDLYFMCLGNNVAATHLLLVASYFLFSINVQVFKVCVFYLKIYIKKSYIHNQSRSSAVTFEKCFHVESLASL